MRKYIFFRLVPAKLKQDDPNPPTKYARDHPIFQKIWVLITEGIWREEDAHWMPMAKEALDLVFQLGDGPDSLAGDMIKDVCSKIQEEHNRLVGSEMGDELKVETFILRRLCFHKRSEGGGPGGRRRRRPPRTLLFFTYRKRRTLLFFT